MTHYYISTACQHDLCPRCRILCKFCGSECLCMCHHPPKEPTVSNPENLDNPGVPDQDWTEPAATTEGDGSLDDLPDLDLDTVDNGDDEDGDDNPEDAEPVDPPADDTDPGDAEDFAEDPNEPPAEAEPDDAPTPTGDLS